MNWALKMVSATFVAFALLVGVYDLKSVQFIKHRLKDSLDLATKAAALQIDTDPNKIADGIFEIDTSLGKTTFNTIFKENMGDKYVGSVKNIDIVNVHTKELYTAPNGDVYNISSPTIFASAEYDYDGIFWNEKVSVETLSGSTIVNKNDI